MKVYPEYLPAKIIDDEQRSAEIRIYELLAKIKSDDHCAFYSKDWECLSGVISNQKLVDPLTGQVEPRNNYPMGEIDFIILSPRGILVIEVKGGGVSIEEGTWLSTDRYGVTHNISDPLSQARKGMFTVLSRLNNLPHFAGRFFNVGYAAILYHTLTWQHNVFLPDAIFKLVIFQEHVNEVMLLEKLKLTINRWQQVWSGYRDRVDYFSSADIKKITAAYAPTVEVRKPKLGFTVQEHEEEMLTLKESQYYILQGLSANRKAIIYGNAGTGKTLLAMEKARRSALQGQKTLFTCVNRLLSKNVKNQLENIDNLEVFNFHQLCYQWGSRAGRVDLIDPDAAKTVGRVPTDYYQNVLPEALFEAAELLPDKNKYDAVIVDEAQEMNDQYWIALLACIKNDDPVFYIFCDPNQAIWRLQDNLPFIETSFQLSENLRNSRKIFEAVKKLCPDDQYEAKCVEEGHLEIIILEDIEKQLEMKIIELLSNLISQRIALKDIVIITGKSRESSILYNRKSVGNHPITLDLDDRTDKVLFSSARRYRGMEAQVVIMIEVDAITDLKKLRHELRDRMDLTEDDQLLERIANETLLIAISRAQHSLYIIVDGDTAESLGNWGLDTISLQ
jgi:hypothetical protein